MPSTCGPRAAWRKPLLVFGSLLATAPFVATAPAHGTAKAAVPAPGCCEAYLMWGGALQEVVVLPERGILKKSIPPGWAPFGRVQHYYLPRGKKIQLGAVLGGNAQTSRSRGRHQWDLDCFAPRKYRKSSAWAWIDVPGGPSPSPSAPITPVKNFYASLNTENCVDGYVWVKYDQGDHRYGKAGFFTFSPGRNRPVPRTVTVWKWVTKAEARTVARTGRYPVPKGTEVGQYFFTDRAYADKVAGWFKGHRLVRGTLQGGDRMFSFTENKKTDNGIVGAFFRKQLARPKATFKVVK